MEIKRPAAYYEIVKNVNVDSLLGKTLVAIHVSSEKTDIVFTDSDGARWMMYHDQECCEAVSIEDVAGEWADLLGSPLLLAEVVTNCSEPKNNEYSEQTWTFYKFATARGYVTVRWYGDSNGYYSTGVDFARLKDVNENS